MVDILHDFPVQAAPQQVFEEVATPRGLDAWWTETAIGEPRVGATYALGFGADFSWRGRVIRCVPGAAFELEITVADADWTGTRVAFDLEPRDGGTWVRFRHAGWREASAHHRQSSFCWAMYLRLLQRHVERGEVVPYAARLET